MNKRKVLYCRCRRSYVVTGRRGGGVQWPAPLSVRTPTNFFTLNMYLFLDRRRCKKFKGPGQIRRMNKASRSPRPGANPFCAAKATPFVSPPLPEDFARINV